MSRTYFCVKSQVYVLSLIPGGSSTMKKAWKSVSEGYVGDTKMMGDFESIYKITKPFPN